MIRVALIVALVLAAATLCGAAWAFFAKSLPTDKLLSTSSGLLGIAALMQLEVSGWFTRVMELYGDEEKFPYGPPSHITRQIIDNPDHPFQSWLRNTVFFDPRTALCLGLASLVVGILASWA